MKNNYARRTLSSSSGQAAVVLILVIAASLIYYAVSVNFAQIAEVKALVTVATDTSAALLGSYMASYGERLSQEQLKGDDTLKAATGLFSSIITLIVVVVAAVIFQQYWLLAVLAVAVSSASVVMQATIIQPQITEAWNSMAQDTMDDENQFSEQAIQSALSKVVTDDVQVPDVTDMDRDTNWVPLNDLDTRPFKDTVNRFSIYYDRRINQIQGMVISDVEDFLNALAHFLYAGDPNVIYPGNPDDLVNYPPHPGDSWGIHDHYSPDICSNNSECQPCCSTERSSKCYADGKNATDWATACGNFSPYPQYPWVFDPTFENPDNNFYSLRELIGQDDQHTDFYKDSNDPNTGPPPSWPLPPGFTANQNTHIPVVDQAFYLEDATGFYVNPPATGFNVNPPCTPLTCPDNRKGIFPFFHKMSEWGVDLTSVEANSPGFVAPLERECHWQCKDPWRDCIEDCNVAFREGPFDHPLEIPQLSLPLNPLVLAYNRTFIVDGSNLTPGNPPLWVDKVTMSFDPLNPRPNPIIADDNTCAMSSLYPPGDEDNPDPTKGFWREGTDMFCGSPDTAPVTNTNWPYYYGAGCTHQNVGAGSCSDPLNPQCCDDPGTPLFIEPCGCGQGVANPDQFPDDPIDMLYIGLGDFIFLAENLFSFDSNPGEFFDWVEALGKFMRRDFTSWRKLYAQAIALPNFYSKVYKWIEPNTSNWRYPILGVVATRTSPEKCYFCQGLVSGDITGKEGRLFKHLKTMFRMRNRIYGWIVNHDWTARTDQVGRIGLIDPVTDNLSQDNHGYTGDYCKEVWCLPSENGYTCPEIQADERRPVAGMTTDFDSNMNGIVGDVADIVACLDHNVNEEIILNGSPYGGGLLPSTYRGNAERFRACSRGCKRCQASYDALNPNQSDAGGAAINCTSDVNAACGCTPDANFDCGGAPKTYLPRTLVPGFDPNLDFDPINTPRLQQLLACRATCDICQEDCVQDQQDCEDACDPAGPPCRCPDCTVECTCLEFNCEDKIFPVPVPPEWLDAITSAYGSCREASTVHGSFLNFVSKSVSEAENQVAKFAKRMDFLQKRLTEAQNIIATLDTAIGKFEGFLVGPNSPAQQLIQARIDHTLLGDVGLPYHAIYGWRSKTSSPTEVGKWHIVKVEARLPGRCDNACNIFQIPPPAALNVVLDLAGAVQAFADLVNEVTLGFIDFTDATDFVATFFDPDWPDIETEGTLFRTYKLVNKEGIVKFRTTRYDEEIGAGRLRFPNGAKIWDFRFGHPKRPLNVSASDLARECKTPGDTDSPTITVMPDGNAVPTVPLVGGIPIYDGAFMMNRREGNEACWDLAHEFLAKGVVSERCAAYYWDDTTEIPPVPGISGAGGKRMRFIFVNCQPF